MFSDSISWKLLENELENVTIKYWDRKFWAEIAINSLWYAYFALYEHRDLIRYPVQYEICIWGQATFVVGAIFMNFLILMKEKPICIFNQVTKKKNERQKTLLIINFLIIATQKRSPKDSWK